MYGGNNCQVGLGGIGTIQKLQNDHTCLLMGSIINTWLTKVLKWGVCLKLTSERTYGHLGLLKLIKLPRGATSVWQKSARYINGGGNINETNRHKWWSRRLWVDK